MKITIDQQVYYLYLITYLIICKIKLLAGRLNINLANFDATSDQYYDHNVYTILHEMTHALAFSSGLMNYYITDTGSFKGLDNVVKQLFFLFSFLSYKFYIRDEKGRYYFITSKIDEVAKAYYNCSTTRAYVEDDGKNNLSYIFI